MKPIDPYLLALAEHQAVFEQLRGLSSAVDTLAKRLADAIAKGHKIMFCGNGGSAADSQHLAAELTGRLVYDRPSIGGMALSTDSSALTCIGNDYGFEQIFARQVAGLGQAGDVLVAISTSGNSENVIQAVHAAHAKGIATVGLLGHDGGKLLALCQHCLVVPSPTTARIQEAHIFLGHNLCAGIERYLGY